ncbi:flagellar protein FlaG [Paenibacillus pabuli]|uniref:flagellar protein FlaG n=1 Tax=Paenibacillus pabuli TaxID=1472 RepID=UPI0020004B55|nr:flagellar protein FlaG [Paenibacillus pabuli]UPK43469.1 flagellar protein FlaG [Paenibacillus pabuli]
MNSDISFSGRTTQINTNTNVINHQMDSSNPKPLIINKDQMIRLEANGVNITLGEAQLIKAIDRAIKAMEGPETTFEVSVHKQTNSIMVKVLNKETGDLIREIPPEKTLNLVAKMMEIAGIIIDERV